MSAETVRFGLLCSMFQAMVRDRSSVQKRKRLRTFLDRVYTGKEYFSAIRLILPSLDRERGTYGLKESTLAACLVDAMGISKDSEDALRLINWRKGGARAGVNAGNFALIASEVLQRRQGMASGGLTIKEVNDALDELASKDNRGDKALVLSNLIKKTNAVEMKWILMIILKDLKLGISEKSIFNEFHPDAEDLFNVTCDLKLVCEKLKDRSQRHKRQDIEVGKAVRPQLAMRVSDAVTAWKKLHGKQVVVECKFDGDRIQIHKSGAEINYFSRNFLDHSEYAHGMSDVILQNVLADRCILDGEMLVWDTSSQRFAEFGSNQEIAKVAREGLECDRQLCYVAFDILYVGDTSVIHQSLAERHDLLRKVVKPVKGRLEILVPDGGLNDRRAPGEPCWSIVAYNLEDVERFFKQTIENRDEGIVLKDLGSKWEPSDRSGKWLKLKPDYIHAAADLDVLIIGGYYGSGRRGGEVAQFLVGLAEPAPSEIHPKRFMSFCRVGTGLSDDELDSLVNKLKPYFRKNEHPKKAPRFYEVTNNAKERPDVWIDSPDKSVILSIASDIRTIKSEVFSAPYSLRFPRIHRVRYDKPWHECLDVQSFVDLVHSSNGSTQRGTYHADVHGHNAKHAKVSKKAEKGKFSVVPAHFVRTDISGVKEESFIFTSMMFYFANIPSSYSMDYFHKLVVEHGGMFSMNLNDSVTHCIAAEKKGIKYQAATRRGDVIHYSWVLDCCAQKRLVHLQPKYFLFIAESSKSKFQEEMDAFSDYYYWDVDPTDIKQVFSNMKGSDDTKAISYYQKKYCPMQSWCIFHDCSIYFVETFPTVYPDLKMISEIALRRMKIEVTFRGGEVINRLARATHLIAYPATDPVKDFDRIYKSFPSSQRYVLHGNKFHVVSHKWLEDSVAKERKLPEDVYNLRPHSFDTFEIEESKNDLEVPLQEGENQQPVPSVQRVKQSRRGRSATSSPRKRGIVAQPARRTRARIGHRSAKIDQDESETSAASDVDVRESSHDKGEEHEGKKNLEKEENLGRLHEGRTTKQQIRQDPRVSNPRKGKAATVPTMPARVTRSRIGKRPAIVDQAESENGGSLNDDSELKYVSCGKQEEHQSSKQPETVEHLGYSLESSSSDTRIIPDVAMKDGSDIIYMEKEDGRKEKTSTFDAPKQEFGFDPVQAMLLDMIPSLSQDNIVEPAVFTARPEEQQQLHEPSVRCREKQPQEQEPEPEPNPAKKKKVSYKDVAGELLKDWW